MAERFAVDSRPCIHRCPTTDNESAGATCTRRRAAPISARFWGGKEAMGQYVLAIDQGTTGSTVLIFDRRGRVVGRGYSEFRQHYPKPGWVEHDAEEIWSVTLGVVKAALRKAKIGPKALAAI